MKYALVTGSTKGIGKAISELLGQNGYIVLRNGREPREEEYYIQADLSNMEGVEILIEGVKKYTQTLDCIVFNAGATCRSPFLDITYEEWKKVFDTNVSMPFFIAQQLFDSINKNASVIFIGSAMSLKPHATSIPYGVSKTAINMMVQCLAREFAEKKVRVNAICPGFIDTEWQKQKPDWIKNKISGKTALERFGTPEEVAHMCLAICKNTFANGAVFLLDGGYDLIF